MNSLLSNGNASAAMARDLGRATPTSKGGRGKIQSAELLNSDSAMLRMASVAEFTGLSQATIYRRIKDGTFPAQYKIGPWAARWKSGEIRAWVAAQTRAVQ